MKASSLTTTRDYRTLVEYVEKREKKDVCLFCSMMMNQFCPYVYARTRALSLIRPPQIEPVTERKEKRERREEKNERRRRRREIYIDVYSYSSRRKMIDFYCPNECEGVNEW